MVRLESKVTSSNLSVTQTHRHTHTHRGWVALPELLKWSDR